MTGTSPSDPRRDQDPIRVTFELSPQAELTLDGLAITTGTESRAEVIRVALSFYSLLLSQHRSGRIVVTVPDTANNRTLLARMSGASTLKFDGVDRG